MPVPYGLGREVRFENPPLPPFSKGGLEGILPKGERKEIHPGEGGTGVA